MSVDRKLREEVSVLHAQICDCLAEPNRILILYALAEHPHHVSELASKLELPQPTVSRHLKLLRERGLVNAQREGQLVIYSLVDMRIIQALDLLRALLADLLKSQGELGKSVSQQIHSL
jgi:DNA-binding transcriptional ArsR family regulator